MSKRSRWSYIAAATASVVGVLSLWLPWYGLSLPGVSGALSQAKSLGPFGILTVMIARKLAALHVDAWGALHGWTAIFAAGTVLAGALAIVHATGRDLDRRLGWVAAAGALAAVLFAAYEIAEPPGGNAGVAVIHVRYGAFVALAGAAVALGAWVVAQLDRSPAVPVVGEAPAVAPVSMALPAASVSIVSPAASTSIAPPGWS